MEALRKYIYNSKECRWAQLSNHFEPNRVGSSAEAVPCEKCDVCKSRLDGDLERNLAPLAKAVMLSVLGAQLERVGNRDCNGVSPTDLKTFQRKYKEKHAENANRPARHVAITSFEAFRKTSFDDRAATLVEAFGEFITRRPPPPPPRLAPLHSAPPHPAAPHVTTPHPNPNPNPTPPTPP